MRLRSIDTAIQRPAEADVAVTASLDGSKVIVRATASKIADGHEDLRLAAGTQPTSPTFKVLQAAWAAVSAPTTRRE